MRLVVLGSGSRGNALAVESQGAALLIDAGFGPRTLLRRATRAGLTLSGLRGVVLTHEHGDHARGAAGIAEDTGCPVFASGGTLRALDGRLGRAAAVALRADGSPWSIGPFHIAAVPTSHDAAEPLALCVTGPRGARVGIAYDLGCPTPAVRRLLAACTCLVVEANHEDRLLEAGPYPPSVRRRIAGPGGHLSNRAAAALLATLAHQDLQTVVLAHLSDRCNRPGLARRAAHAALERRKFRGTLLVARQSEPLGPIEIGGAVQLSLAPSPAHLLGGPQDLLQ